MTVQKVPGELEDVFATLAQGRHPNLHAAESVVQVCAETTARHELAQRSVRGHDDPRIDPAHAITTDTLDGEVLNSPEQLGLRGLREV